MVFFSGVELANGPAQSFLYNFDTLGVLENKQEIEMILPHTLFDHFLGLMPGMGRTTRIELHPIEDKNMLAYREG